MLEVVRFRADWPGLTQSGSEGLYWSARLDLVRNELHNEVDPLKDSEQAFRGRMGRLAAERKVETTFGGWRLAVDLWEAQLSAYNALLDVAAGLRHNIDSAASRLEAVSEFYRDTNSRVAEMIHSRFGNYEIRTEKADSSVWRSADSSEWGFRDWTQTASHRFAYEELSYPVKAVGKFAIASGHVPGEVTGAYPVGYIAQWLRLLQQAKAWNSHYEWARAWHVMGQALAAVSERLYRYALDTEQCWRSRSSTAAQAALQQIEGSVSALANFSADLRPVNEATGATLEREINDLRIGIGAAWPLTSRHTSDIRAVFGRINKSYQEIINSYPRAVPFHLPFGGVSVPRHRSSPHHRSSVAVAGSDASDPAETGAPNEGGPGSPPVQYEGGVIGGTGPAASEPISDDHDSFWNLGGGWTPPVIG